MNPIRTELESASGTDAEPTPASTPPEPRPLRQPLFRGTAAALRALLQPPQQRLAATLRSLIAAPACPLCLGRSDGLLCRSCFVDLPWNRVACPHCALPLPGTVSHPCRRCARRPPPFALAHAAFRYAAPVDSAIHGVKYNADFLSARWLGEALAHSVAQRSAVLPELLIPVPLHAARLRRRGYNQAHELARVAAAMLGLPCPPGLARRIRATEDQIGKTAAQRRRNLRGAFTVMDAIAGCRVALVDDVMTTGSTLVELTRACRNAGARHIEVWCVARVE
jgi:ComF family protein